MDGSISCVFESHEKKLGGGFKHLLFSPRKLGKMNPFWRAYFSIGWFNHQLEKHFSGVGSILDHLGLDLRCTV